MLLAGAAIAGVVIYKKFILTAAPATAELAHTMWADPALEAETAGAEMAVQSAPSASSLEPPL